MSKSSIATSDSGISQDLLYDLEKFFKQEYLDHRPGSVLQHDDFIITVGVYSSRHLRKLSIDDVASIKMAYHDGITVSVLARAFDVHHTCISQIVNNQTWKYVSVLNTKTGITL